MSWENLNKLLTRPWTRHFEEVAQNHLIQNKLLAVYPMMPRAYDTGVAGTNLVARDLVVEFQNPPTPKELQIGIDLRGHWEADYAAQAVFGFGEGC